MANDFIHDSDCSVNNAPALPAGECDCEAGKLAKFCEGLPPDQAEIARAWHILESHSFPPEAQGWPFVSIQGKLPDAIDSAIKCLVQQREDLQAEVDRLRSNQQSKE